MKAEKSVHIAEEAWRSGITEMITVGLTKLNAVCKTCPHFQGTENPCNKGRVDICELGFCDQHPNLLYALTAQDWFDNERI